jgi:hypothetical protein
LDDGAPSDKKNYQRITRFKAMSNNAGLPVFLDTST